MTLNSLSKTAGNVMSSPPVVVNAGTSLREAAKVMVQHNIGCLPVVDDLGKFVGMITERTFQAELAGVKPDSALTPDQRVFEQLFVDAGTGLKRVEDRYLESRNAPVESVMVSNEPTVSRETPLWAVADALLKSHLSHIAVVEDGKPVGVIARHDLLRTYANGDLISR